MKNTAALIPTLFLSCAIACAGNTTFTLSGKNLRKGNILRSYSLAYENESSSTILASSFPFLDSLSRLMQTHPGLLLQIGVYDSYPGPDPLNLKRTEFRAERIRQYLQEKGVPPDRFVALGFGQQNLLHPMNEVNAKPENEQERYHALNRRVEIEILDYNKNIFSAGDTHFRRGAILRTYALSSYPYFAGRIEPESLPFLDSMAAFLLRNPGLKMEIGMHLTKTDDSNVADSAAETRAIAIRDYFVQKGVAAERLQTRNYSDSRPLVRSEKIQQQHLASRRYALNKVNQRTEFRIISR